MIPDNDDRMPASSGRAGSQDSSSFQWGTGSLEWERMRSKFKLPSTETLIDDFSCAIYKQILLHGRLYLSQHFLCFYSNLFGYTTLEVISLEKITALEKRLINLINPGIMVYVEESKSKYEFASFVSRDTTFNILQYVLWNLDRTSSLRRRMVSLPASDSQARLASQPSDEYRLRRRSSECSSGCSTCSSEEYSDFYSEDGGEEALEDGPAGSSSRDGGASTGPPGDEAARAAAAGQPYPSGASVLGDGVHFLSGQHPFEDVIREKRFDGVRDADALFNAFFGEGSEFLAVYHRLRNDVDVKVHPWNAHPHFGLVRDVSFCSPVKSPFGSRMAQVHETHRLIRASRNEMVLELASITTGVPFGDHFRVESRWTIRAHDTGRPDDEAAPDAAASSPPSSSASSVNGESGSASGHPAPDATLPPSPRPDPPSRRPSRAERPPAAAEGPQRVPYCTLSIIVGVQFTKSTYGWLKGKIEETAVRESASSYQALVSHMSEWLAAPPDPRTRAALAGTLLPAGSSGVAVGSASAALQQPPPLASATASPPHASRSRSELPGAAEDGPAPRQHRHRGLRHRPHRHHRTPRYPPQTASVPPPLNVDPEPLFPDAPDASAPRRTLPPRSANSSAATPHGGVPCFPAAAETPPPAPPTPLSATEAAGSVVRLARDAAGGIASRAGGIVQWALAPIVRPATPVPRPPPRQRSSRPGEARGSRELVARRGGRDRWRRGERLLVAGLVAAFVSILVCMTALQLRSTAGLHSRVDLLELLLARTVATDLPPRFHSPPWLQSNSYAPSCSSCPVSAQAPAAAGGGEPWPGGGARGDPAAELLREARGASCGRAPAAPLDPQAQHG